MAIGGSDYEHRYTDFYGSDKDVEKFMKTSILNGDKVFRQEFKDRIKTFCVCNLFSNYTGIMLGNGQIWINNKPNSTKSKFDFYIISINN